MRLSWNEYKNRVSDNLLSGKSIYRGQSDSNWKLTTSLHRTGLANRLQDLITYFELVVPHVQERVEAWDGTRRDLTKPADMAQFIAFLQHNGYPTPLLDWSYSPYIAAFFAFDGVNHFDPSAEFISIYEFNAADWTTEFTQIYDYKHEKEHVSVLTPTIRGNHKQMLQQGLFMYTNCVDVEDHIKNNEFDGQSYLTKYEIPVGERTFAIRDLALMGVTMMQLAPSVESVCKAHFNEVSTRFSVGLKPNIQDLSNHP
ncbi:FRG domain-containing protein [Vibrio sp. MACH09]|uniref:FRG domain-containing protein n=1 Tax=Vibrio sp. MACH09 TaxID=3025122 RepID=UPI00278E085E|nr:FRG domain-containing protein [Vibrio sp. MACH09]GLO63385.1 FRG domain-containing protein [Vibrio sp. MACH09]